MIFFLFNVFLFYFKSALDENDTSNIEYSKIIAILNYLYVIFCYAVRNETLKTTVLVGKQSCREKFTEYTH